MKTISGFNIHFDFGKLTKVSDLIYFDGPLLSHYMSSKGENYLFYWVDVDEIYNRWLVVRTDIVTIQQYLDKKISLYTVMSTPNDGFLYMVDIDANASYHNIQLIQVDSLPEDYLPGQDSFYAFEPSDDIDLAAISQKYSCGILELHIDGKDVKYGSIPLQKLAPIIPKIEDIRKTLSAKYIKHVRQSLTSKKDESKQNITRALYLDTQYEYMCSMTGSIRMILKPLNQQISFTKTYADSFAEELIKLFESGYKKEDITSFSKTYDKSIIKKYNDFIYYLNGENLSFGMKWCNVNAGIALQQKIGLKDTEKILTNLSDFEFNDKEDIVVKGCFYSLNVKSGSYSFESAEGDDFKSTGYLDKARRELAQTITFNKTYQVVIERKIAEQIGSKEKKEDTIVSITEVPEE